MTRTLFTILTILGLASCNNDKTTSIERDGQPTVYQVGGDDKEMNTAIGLANATLDNFTKALQSNNADFVNFALKTRFNTPQGGEHIWVSNITLDNNDFFGVVDNLPESTTDVKIGDKIKIDKKNISDWMYIDKGKLRGGYTIILLRNRMTDAERKQFDIESGHIIQ